MTRYLKLQLNANGTGFLPGYAYFPQATDATQKVKPFLLDFAVSASLPVNNSQAGCIEVPDGAQAANIIVFKADGSTESLGAITLGSTGASSTVQLSSSKSAYKVLTNCVCWDITDVAEVKMQSTYFMMENGPSWKPSSFNGVCFESGGRHIFWTNGSATTLVNTHSYGSIPALTGQQINSYTVPYKEITVHGLPDGNTHVKAEFTFGNVDVDSYMVGSEIYVSTNLNNIRLTATRNQCTDVQKLLQYDDDMDTVVSLTPVAWPVLTLKSTDMSMSIVCKNQTADSSNTKTIVCEPNEIVNFVVHKSDSTIEVTDSIAMGTDKEVDAASYAEYFLSDDPVDVHSVTIKTTNADLYGTHDNVTVDNLHPYTFTVEDGTVVEIALRSLNSEEVKTLAITVEQSTIIDLALYSYLFDSQGGEDTPSSGHSITIVNNSSKSVDLVIVKNGQEYYLGSCNSGATKSFSYTPSTYWNIGAWKGLSGFEYYIDFKVKSDELSHTFQIVSFQNSWPSSFSHTVTDSILVDEPDTPADVMKAGIGVAVVVIGLVILFLLLRR